MTRFCILPLSLLVACGSSSANPNPGADVDAPTVFMDAPPVVPQTITISGNAAEQAQSGSTPLDGVTIGIFKTGADSAPLATTTTDAQGNYSVEVTTNGEVLDGYVKATKTDYVDTFAYPASPSIGDAPRNDANMLTSSTFNLLVSFGGGSAGKALVTLQVVDASQQPVEGATVESNPASGAYKYSNSSGFPSDTDGTAADGLAFMFDAPPGELTVKAKKAGNSFKSHVLNARADKFTTTVIAP